MIRAQPLSLQHPSHSIQPHTHPARQHRPLRHTPSHQQPGPLHRHTRPPPLPHPAVSHPTIAISPGRPRLVATRPARPCGAGHRRLHRCGCTIAARTPHRRLYRGSQTVLQLLPLLPLGCKPPRPPAESAKNYGLGAVSSRSPHHPPGGEAIGRLRGGRRPRSRNPGHHRLRSQRQLQLQLQPTRHHRRPLALSRHRMHAGRDTRHPAPLQIRPAAAGHIRPA